MTKRQKQIVQLLSEGLIAKEIAGMLGLSTRTIENCIYRMKLKYEASTQFQLAWILKDEL